MTAKRTGSVTLGEVAARAKKLDIACSRCDRSGHLSLANLLAQYGPEMRMPDLGTVLAADCPRSKDSVPSRRCSVFYPNISTIMGSAIKDPKT